MTLHLSFDEILERVYAQSAWHTNCRTDVQPLTTDNVRLLRRSIERAYSDLCRRTAGYLRGCSLNREHATDNVNLQFDLFTTKPYCGLGVQVSAADMEARACVIEATLRSEVVELLASSVLAEHYGSAIPYFEVDERRHRAGLMLLLAHPDRHPC